MTSESVACRVNGLSITTERKPADPLVREVSFSLEKGRATALIGESGCGKSLTSSAIGGLLPHGLTISSGSIELAGIDVTALSDREMRTHRGRAIGMIFQEPMSALDPTARVGDQVAESRRIHLGESRAVALRRAEELLDMVGISSAHRRARDFPHQFSGGMQQRVMIAAAIACDPQLLIADEPTTALDVTVQAEILDLLRRIQQEHGTTVLLVTHDLGVVSQFCERVVVMYAGQVAECGTVDDVLRRPQHPYTAALQSSIPDPTRPRTTLPIIPGRVPTIDRMPSGCRFVTRCAFAVDECRDRYLTVPPDAEAGTSCLRVREQGLVLEAVHHG